MTRPSLLLLAPAGRFGGGIDRIGTAIGDAWPGHSTRLNLFRGRSIPGRAARSLALLRFVAQASADAVRDRPSFVVATHVSLLPVAQMCAHLARGAETALYAHGIEVWGPMSEATRRSVRRCDHLLAGSDFTARRLGERAGVPASRVSVVRPPIMPRAADAAWGSDGTAPDHKPTFITVSRVVEENRYKGHFDIAAAIPEVVRVEPTSRWLVIGGGDDLDALRAECARLGLSGAVELRGEIDDVSLANAYRESLFHVLPSVADPDAVPPTGEGFGIVYAEAASFGLPSIASRAGGGALEFVRDGETGLTVPPHDPPELAAAIVRLLRDPALRSRLGGAARALALERHTPERFTAALRTALLGPSSSDVDS